MSQESVSASSFRKTAFISYAHESHEHKLLVRRFAEKLRGDGVEVVFDQDEYGPRQGWSRWSLDQQGNADFVLNICTPAFRRYFEGKGPPNEGRGVNLEGLILLQRLVDDPSWGGRLVAIVFEPHQDDVIPISLRPFARYFLWRDYDVLRSHLRGNAQHSFVPIPNPSAAAPPVRRTRANLPFLPRYFVGRHDDLRVLHEHLAPGRALKPLEQPRVAVRGLPGVGKTNLVLHYSCEHLDDYETVCWVDAVGPDITARFAALSVEPLALTRPPAESVDDTAKAVRAALEVGGPHLLIFDNVDHPLALSRHFPRSGSVRIIITTRRRDLQGITPMELAVLPPEDAVKLLLRDKHWQESEREAALELCHQLGCLTLALAIASRILMRASARPSSLLHRIQFGPPLAWSEDAPLDQIQPDSPTLTRLFDASVELLRKDDRIDQIATIVLLLAGWFAPSGLSLGLLQNAVTHVNETACSADDLSRACDRLVELGLSEADEAGVMTFHQVIGCYARVRSDESIPAAATATLVAIAGATPRDTIALLRLSALVPHFETAAQRLDQTSASNDWQIALCLARYYKQAAQYERTLYWCERAQQALPDVPLLADFLYEGSKALHRGQGQYAEAERYLRLALAIKERALGTESPEVAMILNAIGQSVASQQLPAQALEVYRRALAIKEKTFGRRHPVTAITLNAIGQLLGVGGELDRSLAYLREALDVKVATLGEGHPEVAITLSTTGQVLAKRGEYDEACRFFDRSLAIKRECFGQDHPEVGITLTALAQAALAQGDRRLAHNYSHQAVHILEVRLGAHHPFTTASRRVYELTDDIGA